MFGLVGAGAAVSGKRLGRHQLFGISIVTIFIVGRVILVLPFCSQPRLEPDSWHFIVGGIIFFAGLILCTPGLTIKPFTAPESQMKLRTSGFYGIVRNPIYLGELLWGLGWAIIFRSIIGIALVPLWWAGLWSLVIIEEGSMERALGKPYLEYKEKVKGRIIPGLPL